MRRAVTEYEYEDDQAEDDRVSQSLAAMAFALFLIVVGLFLFQQLSAKARIEDCLLAGRSNCDAVIDHPYAIPGF